MNPYHKFPVPKQNARREEMAQEWNRRDAHKKGGPELITDGTETSMTAQEVQEPKAETKSGDEEEHTRVGE